MTARAWIAGVALTAAVAMLLLALPSRYDREAGARPAKVKFASLVPPPAAASLSPRGALSEPQRRAIYAEVIRAEALAAQEAERAFADSGGATKRQEKRRAVQEGLAAKYRIQIAAREGLTPEQLTRIVEEGRAKNWPV